MGIMDTVRGLIPRADAGAPNRLPSQIGQGSSFMRGGRGVTFAGWDPALRKINDQVGESWDKASARAFDLIVNSGWLSGAVDQAVANTVGDGLRLKAMPDAVGMGMDEKAARDWARLVEREFRHWAEAPTECDIEGTRTFNQMQATLFRSWITTGEILAELPYRVRPWGAFGTKVRLLEPARISRRTDPGQRLVNGVYTDADGMPIGYLARKDDGLLGVIEYRVRARDRAGRPRVIHVFDGLPAQKRGITPLVPALQVAKQFDQLSDATLMASIVQALFAVTITGDEPTEDFLQGLLTPQEQARMARDGVSALEVYLDAMGGYYDGATLDVGINGRLAHLFPGQDMKFHTTGHPGGDYAEFAKHLLREIARCLGLTYESATGDYDSATYSSVRMATGEIFKVTQYRRRHIIRPFCQPVYEAWLEEAIEIGRVPFPGGVEGFMASRAAACRAEWRGSPKPVADDLKTAKAHQTWRTMGVMSDEMIANDLGVEIEDVYDQLKREQEMREERGLRDPYEPVDDLSERADEKEADVGADD